MSGINIIFNASIINGKLFPRSLQEDQIMFLIDFFAAAGSEWEGQLLTSGK